MVTKGPEGARCRRGITRRREHTLGFTELSIERKRGQLDCTIIEKTYQNQKREASVAGGTGRTRHPQLSGVCLPSTGLIPKATESHGDRGTRFSVCACVSVCVCEHLCVCGGREERASVSLGQFEREHAGGAQSRHGRFHQGLRK